MTLNFKKIAALASPIATLIVPAQALAAPPANLRPEIGTGSTPFVPSNILGIISALIQFIIVAAFIIAFIMLIVGGIRWILAGGDEKAVGAARNTITAALIGLVVVLAAFALIKLVETFFGITLLGGNVTIPTVTTRD